MALNSHKHAPGGMTALQELGHMALSHITHRPILPNITLIIKGRKDPEGDMVPWNVETSACDMTG